MDKIFCCICEQEIHGFHYLTNNCLPLCCECNHNECDDYSLTRDGGQYFVEGEDE